MHSITGCAVALSTLALLVNAIAADASSAKCYYPNGDYQPLDTPCNPHAKESNCCAPDDICLSNGLCYRANINRLHRGVSEPHTLIESPLTGPSQSCTDPTFSSDSCTSICTGPNDISTGFADVLECPLTSNWYCGWGNQSRCNERMTFQIPDGYFADNRNVSSTKATVTVTEDCTSTPRHTPNSAKPKSPNAVGTGTGAVGTGAATSVPASVATSNVTVNTTAPALPHATTAATFKGAADTVHILGKMPLVLLGVAAVMFLF